MTYKGAPLTSERQDWATPLAFMEFLQERFGFSPDLDCAASCDNTKAPSFFDGSPDCDGLVNPWAGNVYCHPPFGRELPLWLEKCKKEIQRNEVKSIYCLIPARTDTKWFHEIVMPNAYLVYLIKGRLNMIGSGNVPGANAPFPHMVVVWRRHRLPDCGITTLEVPAFARGFNG